MKAEILFKVHEDEDCEKFLWMVRYLYCKYGIDIRPLSIKERLFPTDINNIIPSIVIFNTYIIGLASIVDLYERTFNISNLLDRSENFRKKNPEYRITDLSTHRN